MVSTEEKKIIEDTECKNKNKETAFTPKWMIAVITVIMLQIITAIMLVMSVFNQVAIRDRIDMIHGNSEEVFLCILSKPVDERTITTLQKCKEKARKDDS